MELSGSDHSQLVGGPPWQVFGHVTMRCRWIDKERHCDALMRLAAGMQAVSTCPPRMGQPWARLCVTTESLIASATRQHLPTLDGGKSRIDIAANRVHQICREAQETGHAIFPAARSRVIEGSV